MSSERGFVMPELLLTMSLLVIVASVAAPRGYNLWQRAALEYETTRLANDLRTLFSEQRRVFYDRAYFDTVKPQETDNLSLVIEDSGYRVEDWRTRTLWRHICLPGIRMVLRGNKTRMTVDRYGYTSYNNTVVVYYGDGNNKLPRYGRRRYVIVDTAGRVRVDWQAP